MLESGFGKEYPGDIADGSLNATGEFVALTSMIMVGDERLSYYTDDTLNDDERLSIAYGNDVVSEKDALKGISEEEANEAIDRVMDFYCGADKFPEYCSIKLEEDVVNGTEWEISNHNDDYSVLVFDKESFAGNEGDVILLRDEMGIAFPVVISGITEDDNTITVNTTEVDDSKNVIEAIEFSGAEEIERRIEEMINEWLEENCGGC